MLRILQPPETPSPAHDLEVEKGGSGGARRGLGLLAKAVIAMLVVGLLPLVVYGGITLQQQQTRVRMEAERTLQSTAERTSAEVEEWLIENVRVLQTATQLSGMTSMETGRQVEILTAIQRTHPWIYLLHTIGPNGMNIARSDGNPRMNYADRGFYRDIMLLGKQVALQTVIGKTSRKPALAIAVAIKSEERTVGLLVAAMAVEEISRGVATWKSGQTGFAFLVDQTAKVVAHPRQEFALTQVSLADHPLVAAFRGTGKPGLVSFTEGDQEILGYVQGTRLGWVVGVQQSQVELLRPVRSARMLGLAMLIGASLCVAIAARLASRILVEPIVELTAKADEMSLGELGDPIASARLDELGNLAMALERLRKSMQFAIDRIEQSPPPV
jgi:methyl-accepting chemotaxis protein